MITCRLATLIEAINLCVLTAISATVELSNKIEHFAVSLLTWTTYDTFFEKADFQVFPRVHCISFGLSHAKVRVFLMYVREPIVCLLVERERRIDILRLHR